MESVLWNFHQVYTTMYYSLTVNIRFRDINYFVISDSSQNVVQGWVFFLLETCFIQLDHFMILDTHVCEEPSSVTHDWSCDQSNQLLLIDNGNNVYKQKKSVNEKFHKAKPKMWGSFPQVFVTVTRKCIDTAGTCFRYFTILSIQIWRFTPGYVCL